MNLKILPMKIWDVEDGKSSNEHIRYLVLDFAYNPPRSVRCYDSLVEAEMFVTTPTDYNYNPRMFE